ncbi:hypothetical protein LIPSTDRAFT_284658 [Lipomyces starkeyi NRRL Y-11557]|uniref:Uncharacterized protein n=1 Tax=Lipomyces starkeyi NRRL Y-11557 TaxID=675824 RepID=A0A1E3Q7Z7_LIPST|nr:hypothetical protein LIPSTDRAFT_284658 [Lipomyces starkeyi NRRL Y-11557]
MAICTTGNLCLHTVAGFRVRGIDSFCAANRLAVRAAVSTDNGERNIASRSSSPDSRSADALYNFCGKCWL